MILKLIFQMCVIVRVLEYCTCVISWNGSEFVGNSAMYMYIYSQDVQLLYMSY